MTSEHYFQAQKFVDTLHLEAIRIAKTPKDSANMGRERNESERNIAAENGLFLVSRSQNVKFD